VRVEALLEGLFGSGDADSGATGGGGGQGGAGASPTQAESGVGRLKGQFTFQAIPEASRLVVVAKSPENLYIIDEILAGVDQPQTAGLPEIIELKHANAEELAEQLNALLSREGTLAQIPRQETGLSESSSNISPFAEPADDTGDDAAASADLITFWWQRAQPPVDNRGASNIVGRIRLVPVWRQNAVMVLSPPEYRAALIDLVGQLDRPGRQVLISAVVAEVSLDDATALGLRWSSSPINLSRTDNALSVGTSTTAQENDILGNLFDTSVLDVTADLNLVLQALNENAGVNILSEPKIFTADNQEAEFFDGQDIPFVTEVQLTDNGTRNETREYRAVGIQLRARPRITVNRDVDLRVNLELSSISPQSTSDGQFVVDRRETTTQLIVRDGQTVVISGILRSQDSDVKRKVPLLGDIPLIGLLFTSIEKTTTSTELVAFITPRVIDNTADLDTFNRPFTNRLDQLRERLGKEAPEPVDPSLLAPVPSEEQPVPIDPDAPQ
jgi:general secretion pathway protein D